MANEIAAQLEADLAAAVRDGKVPHGIVYATNADGSFEYHHSTGYQNYGVDETPIRDDAVLMLASMSKLLTAIAMMKAVELGILTLDDSVLPHLPELAAKKILTGFDANNEPILEERKKDITLRHLLTHTSGLEYGLHPLIAQWRKQNNLERPELANSGEVLVRYDHPLIAQPGDLWVYSPALDYAGLLLHRVSGKTLEDFSQEHLWRPLGISDITFWPAAQTPSLLPRVPTLVDRVDPTTTTTTTTTSPSTLGPLAPHTTEHINTRARDCFGGHGAYASAGSYLRVLRSLLANDEKLLSRASVAELFRPQLSAQAATGLAYLREHHGDVIPGEQPAGIPVDHSLGGQVYLADDEGRRRKGTLAWAGMTNPMWSIDRAADLAIVWGVQVLPSGDAGCKEVSGVVERAVYRMAGKA